MSYDMSKWEEDMNTNSGDIGESIVYEQARSNHSKHKTPQKNCKLCKDMYWGKNENV